MIYNGVKRTSLVLMRRTHIMNNTLYLNHASQLQSIAIILLIYSLCILLTAKTSTASAVHCIPSLPPHRFNPSVSPSSSSLTFCKEYSPATCCNSTHTNIIMKQLSPFFSFSLDELEEGYGVSEACKNYAVSIFCSPCSAEMGTGQQTGICSSSCDHFYTACQSALFENVNGQLQPCSSKSLICTPLNHIVNKSNRTYRTNNRSICS